MCRYFLPHPALRPALRFSRMLLSILDKSPVTDLFRFRVRVRVSFRVRVTLDGDAYCWGESPPRPAINPVYREVRGLHMEPRRTPLLSMANTSQALMFSANLVTTPTLTRTYPRRCPPAQSPPGSRSLPAVSTRVHWLPPGAWTAMPSAGVSRRLAPP